MKITLLPITSITPYARNPRRNQGVPVSKVKASLKEYGWQQPIVVDKDMTIVVGHTRYMAAMELGMKEVPVHVADNLTPTQIKAYRLADNKTATFSEWDMELLALEIEDLKAVDFDLDLTGFDAEELAAIDGLDFEGDADAPADDGVYSRKIEAPIYEPTGPCPPITELYDSGKYSELETGIVARRRFSGKNTKNPANRAG